MEIRQFRLSDRDACIRLFEANRDSFFSKVPQQEFINLLDDSTTAIFVAEHNDNIVGGGAFSKSSILWLMVHPELQRQGIGRFLAMFLLREMGKTDPVPSVSVKTIPATSVFFEKLGFRPVASQPDQIELIKKMDVCA